jgi:hypothetical protein
MSREPENYQICYCWQKIKFNIKIEAIALLHFKGAEILRRLSV